MIGRRPASRAGRWAAAVIGVALAIPTACTGDDAPAAGSPGASTTTTTEAGVPWPDQVAAPPDGRHDPTIVLERLDELTYSSTNDLVNRRDAKAVECMAGRGFDLVLGSGTLTPARVPGTPEPEEYTRREFATRWGFGLAASLGEDGKVDPAVLALMSTRVPSPREMADADGVPTVRVDMGKSLVANQGRLDELTAALFEDGDEASCEDRANDEMKLLTAGPFYAANELRQEITERLAADGELADLSAAYMSCMAAKGFDGLTSPTSAYQSVKSALFSIAGQSDSGAEVPSFASMTPEQRQRLTDLQSRERAMSAANLECEADYTPAATERSDAVQREVLADNAPLVNAVKES